MDRGDCKYSCQIIFVIAIVVVVVVVVVAAVVVVVVSTGMIIFDAGVDLLLEEYMTKNYSLRVLP